MREELEQDILATARDMPSGATSELLSRHPRDEVMEAIAELCADGFVAAVPGEADWMDLTGLTDRGEALLHDLESAD